MFSICGARGHLSEIPDGPPIEIRVTGPTRVQEVGGLRGKRVP